MFVCLLVLLVRGTSRRSEAATNHSDVAAKSVSMTPTITPTKWWIKISATPSPIPSGPTRSATPARSPASDCPVQFSSPLKAETYAYISLSPALPNRVRAGAGLSNTYLGQIEAGNGLKVIDGPICADGYSWWLVESLQGDLRGWTVEGKRSEQWVLPCSNRSVSCRQTAMSTTSIVASNQRDNEDKSENNCKSNKLAAGMFAQVGQDSLLVIRSEPDTGGVRGHAGPMSIVKVIDGPICAGGAVWWKLNVFDLDLVGWATENNLYACPKDSECNLSPF